MHPSRAKSRSESSRFALKFNIALLLALFAAALCHAQDIPIGVTYVCSGEHIYIEGCNIRDTSDTSTCMVAHPDHLTSTGLNTYTSVTRGALKKLLPTCTQPSAKELAAAKAFQKKQQDTYNANAQKAEDQLKAATQPPPADGQPQKPKTPEERAITRCVTSGRLPASCTGNLLLGAFSQMVSQVLPSAAKEPAPGPEIAGVFEGAGAWRLDFIDGGVLVNCSGLAPDQHSYTFEFKSNRAAIVIDTTPKPLVLTLGPDGKTMSAPGPVQLDGVVVTGYNSGLRDASGNPVTATYSGPVFDSNGQRVSHSANFGHATFAPKRASCPALNLSSK